MEKAAELPARCHVLDNSYAWLTSRVKILTVFFMSLNPLGIFSHQLHVRLLPPVPNEPVHSDQHHSRLAACLRSQGDRKGPRSGRPRRKVFLIWCRSCAGPFPLESVPAELSGGQRRPHRKGEAPIRAMLIQPSCSPAWLHEHFVRRGSCLCFQQNLLCGRR